MTLTAGMIVVGNEVLSAKVDEANARFAAKRLRTIGIDLLRVVIIRDELDEIAQDVRQMSTAYDYVFTSGGVGATHDDVTLAGVAQGLDRPLIRHERLVALVESHFKERTNASVLKMAHVPEGTVLHGDGDLVHPILSVDNVYVLPGVPEFFRAKFEYLTSTMQSEPMMLRQIYVRAGEDRIADLLRTTSERFDGVEIGSYPKFDDSDYAVQITVESRNAAALDQAMERLLQGLDARDVVRVK